MYFDEPVGEAIPRSNDRVLGVVLAVNSLALLLLPIGMNPILEWCRNAFAHLA
jgi:NADH-quinone oxidoreductase subunit N